ncbi:VWA domain-containing protein [Millisia brevis]|uniref:VWA domain-containing protein n=1 Tax=Millisia brevis TaxID=264148 RepID=UPI00082C45F7|nr:VWA domain-containing protein [Millisia brevis]
MPAQAAIHFPFTAIVGQDRLRLALLLCAVSPRIGGVLIRGEKGTAKSTAVRALGDLLDGESDSRSSVVELPIGATEDRVIGSIDIEGVLRDGTVAFRPGVLADAHRGVLYVDEVNLLPDHLVDVLLDAAAMGRVTVERDGVSHAYDSRFVLVGTMNPEEGELRPQLLDRFGLVVDVRAPDDIDQRVAVVTRRLDFDRDPEAFVAGYRDEQEELAAAIRAARERLDGVRLEHRRLRRIAEICTRVGVEGMRADLVLALAARAHCALRGGDEVVDQDIRAAAALVLPHRRRRDPFDPPGMTDEELEDALGPPEDDPEPEGPDPDDPEPGGPQPDGPGPEGSDPERSGPNGPGADGSETGDANGPENRTDEATAPDGEPAAAARDRQPSPGETNEQERPAESAGRPAEIGAEFRVRTITPSGRRETTEPGRRAPARTTRGHVVRATDYRTGAVHIPATVLAAGSRPAETNPRRGGREVLPVDLRGTERAGRGPALVVFLLDASGSMAARDRLAAVTGAVLSLLRDAYRRRDTVAVVAARGAGAEVALPPTRSPAIASRLLATLTTGGRSPLAEGLDTARRLIGREAVRDRGRTPLLVILTDGRATGGRDALERMRRAAARVALQGTSVVVIDCESGRIRLGLAADLARRVGGVCLRVDELSADAVAGVVRAA